jgi:Tat protein secretion system quality control protein TatD with DNase activity
VRDRFQRNNDDGSWISSPTEATMRSAPQVRPARAAADTSDLSSFACACCYFRLPEEGLFLPSNESSAQRAQTTSPLAANVGEASEKGGDNSDEPPLPRDAYGILLQKFMRKQEERSEDGDGDEADCTFPFLMVDTHGHAHLDRENRSGDGIYVLPDEESEEEEGVGEEVIGSEGDEIANDRRAMDSIRRPRLTTIVSLTCAVAPSDWNACLAHAASSPRRLCALGVHPWYLDNILDLETNGSSDANDPSHSSSGIGEESSSQTQEASPQSTPLAVAIARGDWLERLRELLLEHPGCLVGEIGLCRQARFVRSYEGGKAEALGLQREVFRAQLLLACQLRRSASVHCVNQHNVLLEVLQSLVERLLTNQQGQQQEAGPESGPPALHLPPAIALHSFTGTSNQVRQLLAWEANVPVQVRGPVPWVSDNGGEAGGDCTMQPTAPLLYFGFSHAVNVAMGSSSAKSRRQGRDTVRAVPLDRLLAESDVSSSRDVAGGTLGAIAYLAATAHDDEEFGTQVMPADSLLRMAKLTSENGVRFLRQQQERQRGDE